MSGNREIENLNQLERFVTQNSNQFVLHTDESNLKTKNNICKKFLHKICENQNCPYLHDLSKVKICSSFMNTGHCHRGDLCDFSHKSANSSNNKGIFACKQFQDFGYCENGESCPYKHAKKVCRNYERGFCQLGPVCPDIHQEIKNPCPSYFLGFCPKGPLCKFAQLNYQSQIHHFERCSFSKSTKL